MDVPSRIDIPASDGQDGIKRCVLGVPSRQSAAASAAIFLFAIDIL